MSTTQIDAVIASLTLEQAQQYAAEEDKYLWVIDNIFDPNELRVTDARVNRVEDALEEILNFVLDTNPTQRRIKMTAANKSVTTNNITFSSDVIKGLCEITEKLNPHFSVEQLVDHVYAECFGEFNNASESNKRGYHAVKMLGYYPI
jgi:hypothetical protein